MCLLKSKNKAEYVKTFKGWKIFKIHEGYQMSNGQLTPLYIAANLKGSIMGGVDLPDLEADVTEATL
jgi:hypothetical protein